MSIETKITQVIDHNLQATRLLNEILQELGSARFTPAAEIQTAPPSIPLMPENLEQFPRFVPNKFVESLTGRIARDIIIKEVNTDEGPVPIAEVPLTDGTTNVVVSMWRGFAKAVETYQAGEVVTLTNLKVRQPYKGVESLSSTKNTTVS